jgi:UPF0042 nucleotide-binding protein
MTTRVVLVTGMSGAGKSSVLKCLEDLGYEAIDNLPLQLLGRLLHQGGQQPGEGTLAEAVAIGVDIRSRDFAVGPLLEQLKPLIARGDLDLTLLFLDCDDLALRRRFTETRRRHPLAADRPVTDGIAHERQLMAPLLAQADRVVDTTALSAVDLRRIVDTEFALIQGLNMTVTLTSFAYRQGLPREADLVFDVRFLANPHYDEKLRPFDGRDQSVGDFISRDEAYAPFFETLSGLLGQLLPHYRREGKSYLTIAVGCTGGRHRSVFVTEQLAGWFGRQGETTVVRHRELERDNEREIDRTVAEDGQDVLPSAPATGATVEEEEKP